MYRNIFTELKWRLDYGKDSEYVIDSHGNVRGINWTEYREVFSLEFFVEKEMRKWLDTMEKNKSFLSRNLIVTSNRIMGISYIIGMYVKIR